METIVTGIDIDSRETLREAIRRLEEQQRQDVIAIKAEMDNAYESLKPKHMVRAIVSEVFTSPATQKTMLQSAVGLGAGFLAKRAVMGKSPGILKRMLGYLVQVGVTNVVGSHTEEIQEKGSNFLERLIQRHHPKPDATNEPAVDRKAYDDEDE